ncbi:hypothetical protein Forpi1262_v008847 [Fusarium oxysporum f. sp. raphani]|uniref:Uncharacterized protein n=1 Tax=Fusarium oxysporum f. sp. raphani TaxID=96318 RepID=A0A8J5Q0E1_FUSOX|nr:hypothetical protein Forpi1262_v008847 [Fusarium oxysporum f. sp. raphani]
MQRLIQPPPELSPEGTDTKWKTRKPSQAQHITSELFFFSLARLEQHQNQNKRHQSDGPFTVENLLLTTYYLASFQVPCCIMVSEETLYFLTPWQSSSVAHL